ncbi:MAG: class I SAM-dependent methyltransferase [Planctomycetota bacterium]
MNELESLTWQKSDDLEFAACNFCGSERAQFVLTENGLNIVRCRDCGLVYVNPRPTPEQLVRFYEQYFPPASENLWQKQMKYIFQKEGRRIIEAMADKTKAVDVLDIGCGMGFFLSLLKKENYRCYGIEISPTAADFARRHLNLNITQNTLLESGFPDNSFDVITLWYVLEHVPNPKEILQKVRHLLKKDGLVIIRTPQLNVRMDQWLFRLIRLRRILPSRLTGWIEKSFLINPPRHLYDYKADHLRRLMAQLGFKKIKIINSYPRSAGSWPELLRRYLWYLLVQVLFCLSRGEIILNSSITIYARK